VSKVGLRKKGASGVDGKGGTEGRGPGWTIVAGDKKYYVAERHWRGQKDSKKGKILACGKKKPSGKKKKRFGPDMVAATARCRADGGPKKKKRETPNQSV